MSIESDMSKNEEEIALAFADSMTWHNPQLCYILDPKTLNSSLIGRRLHKMIIIAKAEKNEQSAANRGSLMAGIKKTNEKILKALKGSE